MQASPSPFRVGTAGWSIPAALAPEFPAPGTHLQRYAARFNAVEINSSFYRPHRPQTYARWADSVPDDFRFSVKMPRAITHEARLVDCAELLDNFLGQCGALGGKRGPLLVQTPPGLRYDDAVAQRFFALLRARHAGDVAFEPRHASWFSAEAEALLHSFGIARVAADPASSPDAARPGGARRILYLRLHGSPQMYYSTYAQESIAAAAAMLMAAIEGSAVLHAQPAQQVWCIFDNTALGAATGNALTMRQTLRNAACR